MPELKCTVQTCTHNKNFIVTWIGSWWEEIMLNVQERLAATVSRSEKEILTVM